MSRVRKLSEAILSKPVEASVNKSRVAEVAHLLRNAEISIPTWDFAPLYPQSDDFEEMCLFYLVLNAINYCYFDERGETFRDGKLRSSTLASVRLTEAWSELKNPQFLSNVDENYLLCELFRAEVPISLVKERTRALREIGEFLTTHVDFTFEKLFKKYKEDAYFVSQILPTYLPTWRDPFFKRSQLFVGMVYGKFQDRKDLPIEKESVKELTVFADYRIPQTLIQMGIIQIELPLLRAIYKEEFIPSGSRRELEIRAATILGSDALTEALNKDRQPNEALNALHADFLLWGTARHKDDVPEGIFVGKDLSHHYTLTTDY